MQLIMSALYKTRYNYKEYIAIYKHAFTLFTEKDIRKHDALGVLEHILILKYGNHYSTRTEQSCIILEKGIQQAR